VNEYKYYIIGLGKVSIAVQGPYYEEWLRDRAASEMRLRTVLLLDVGPDGEIQVGEL